MSGSGVDGGFCFAIQSYWLKTGQMNARTLGACRAMVLVSAFAAEWQLSRLETSHAGTWDSPVAGDKGFIPPAIGTRVRAIKSKLLKEFRSLRSGRESVKDLGAKGRLSDVTGCLTAPRFLEPGGRPVSHEDRFAAFAR